MLAIGFFRGAEIHGDAMLDDFVLLEDLIEDLQGTAAIDHEIFGDNLKPIDDRSTRQDVLVVRLAQADADTVLGEIVETVGAHTKLQDKSDSRRRNSIQR